MKMFLVKNKVGEILMELLSEICAIDVVAADVSNVKFLEYVEDGGDAELGKEISKEECVLDLNGFEATKDDVNAFVGDLKAFVRYNIGEYLKDGRFKERKHEKHEG